MMRLVLLENAWKSHILFKGTQMKRTQSDRQWSTPASHPSILSPEQRSVIHSQRKSQIPHYMHSTAANTHTAGDAAQKQPPVDPASPSDASLCKPVKSLLEVFETLPKFTLNLKQNASARFHPNRTLWVQFLMHFLQSRTLTSHLQRSQFSLCISDVQNNRLQLRKALYLLEVNTTTEQNKDGREAKRPTDIEAAGGTLMQSISTATCGYEAQRSCGRNTGAGSWKRELVLCNRLTGTPPPPANAQFSLQHLYHPPTRSPTSLSLRNQWREPIHVSYLIARGTTGWNATPCMGETRGGREIIDHAKDSACRLTVLVAFPFLSLSVPPSFMFSLQWLLSSLSWFQYDRDFWMHFMAVACVINLLLQRM